TAPGRWSDDWGKGGSQPGCTSTILPLIGRHCKTDCGADVGLCWSKSDIPTEVFWNPSLIPEPAARHR
ncbi:hypothetical protein, partial [Mesorhizobium captivum]|uniref:hypothetical protein n=1 Tax=Mesorhizobium captivum TaxID=3072319 RepID=UPI002A23CB39